MSLLDTIQKGKQSAPRRVMLYGTQGIGKSTFASMAPSPVFIQTEDGLGDIDCEKFEFSTSFDQIIEALTALYSEDHSYRTVVVDSLDALESLIWADVCKKSAKENIEDFGYGKGYAIALTHWHQFLEGLAALREHRGMTIVLVAHTKIARFENPDTASYDRYEPKLHKAASALVQQWCDEVFFASYKVMTKKTDEGFDRTRTQGLGSGERVIRTTERPAHQAKNRLNLPDELPLDWRVYADHVEKTNNTQKERSDNG